MKSKNVVYTLIATGLFLCLISIPWVNAEITPPPDDVDPKSETPTNEGLNVDITSFTMDLTSTENSYDYTITAEGTASDDVVKGYYSIWVYYPDDSGAQESWEESPIDEDRTYGSHGYKEEFFGTGPEGSWSTWKWTFHSSGPIDDSNRNKFEDPEAYWGPIEQMILYIRGYANDSTWDQDSEDITKEYTGIDPSSSDDDDDDASDDDTSDDDTSDDDGDDSPGFEIYLVASAFLIILILIVKRKKQ